MAATTRLFGLPLGLLLLVSSLSLLASAAGGGPLQRWERWRDDEGGAAKIAAVRARAREMADGCVDAVALIRRGARRVGPSCRWLLENMGRAWRFVDRLNASHTHT